MPQLDAITPNPKQPKRKPLVNSRGVAPLPADVNERSRKIMWSIVGVSIVAILIVWFSTLGSRLHSVGSDNSAWTTLKQKLSEIAGTFKQSGNDDIKKIDVNAPTSEDIKTLQTEVFPDADAVTGTINENTNINVNVNQNSNISGSVVNTPINQNTNAS